MPSRQSTGSKITKSFINRRDTIVKNVSASGKSLGELTALHRPRIAGVRGMVRKEKGERGRGGKWRWKRDSEG